MVGTIDCKVGTISIDSDYVPSPYSLAIISIKTYIYIDVSVPTNFKIKSTPCVWIFVMSNQM